MTARTRQQPLDSPPRIRITLDALGLVHTFIPSSRASRSITQSGLFPIISTLLLSLSSVSCASDNALIERPPDVVCPDEVEGEEEPTRYLVGNFPAAREEGTSGGGANPLIRDRASSSNEKEREVFASLRRLDALRRSVSSCA